MVAGNNKALDAARLTRAQMKLDGIKVVVKNPIQKSMENPKSLRRAINGKCYDCIGQDGDPNWRDAIRNCGCVDCTLYGVRPYQNTQ